MSPRFLPFFYGCGCGGDGSLHDEFERLSRSFDESFFNRLQNLIDIPSNSLSWLLFSVEFLTTTHVEAQALVSSLKTPGYGYGSLSDEIDFYKNQIYKISIFFNVVRSDLRCVRNHVNGINLFRIVQILSEGGQVPVPEKLQEARSCFTRWEDESRKCQPNDSNVGMLLGILLMEHVRSSPRRKMRRGKKWLLRRTLHAVEPATVFVGRILASYVYELRVVKFDGFEASLEFMWAYSFNNLKSAVSDEMIRRWWCVGEFEDVEKLAMVLRDLLDDALSGGSNDVVKLTSAVNELKTVKESVEKGLNDLDRSILGLRRMVTTTYECLGPLGIGNRII